VLGIENFRNFALQNMMQVEQILSEVYSGITAGQTGFAMFDGGAHKAYHTLRMLDLPGCEKVHAVEADPFMAETFGKAIAPHSEKIKGRLAFHQAALQDDPKTKRIAWKSSPSHVGRSSIVSANAERDTIWGDNPDMEYRDAMTVPATTIDQILENEQLPVPFIKTDLEGADLIALKGAAATLAKHRPVVAFENSLHSPKVHGFTIDEMIEYFADLGYVGMNFVGETLTKENWFGFFEAWLTPTNHVEELRAHLHSSLAKREVAFA